MEAHFVRFDPPQGKVARRALRRPGAQAAVVYPLFKTDPPLMSSGEIRDRVRFQLRELGWMASSLGVRLRKVRAEGPLAEAARTDLRIALAVAHGVQASFLDLALVAAPGSALARAGRVLGLKVLAGL